MGARAHSRRHSGRAIRKARRQLREWLERLPSPVKFRRLSSAMESLGDAAQEAARGVAALAVAVAREGVYDQSPAEGGEAVRSRLRGFETDVAWIDETHGLEQTDGQ